MGTKPSGKRWLIGGLAMLLVGWLGCVTAIDLLAPSWVENTLVKHIGERLGVAIRIGKVSIDGLNGRLSIYDVAVDDKAGKPLIGFRELHVDYSWRDLLSRVSLVESATLVKPSIHFRLPADGPLTLMQLLPTIDSALIEIPRWKLKHLAIRDGELSYRDERVRPARAFAVSKWGVDLNNIGSTGANGLAEFHGDLAAGASIDWIGHVGLQPLVSKGRLQVTKLSLPDSLGWLPGTLPLAVNNGRLTLDLHYDARLQPAVSLAINNSAMTLEDLSLSLLKAHEEHKLATLTLLQADGLAFAYPSAKWASQSLTLSGAQITIERDARGDFTLLKALAGPPRQVVSSAQPSAPMAWAGGLKQAAMSNIMVNYRDLSTRPATTLKLGPLSLSAEAKTEAKQDVMALKLSTAINTTAQLSLRGELGIPAARAGLIRSVPYFKGHLSVDRLALQPFEGFLTNTLAIRLPSGELSSSGQLQWQTPSAPSWAWSGDSSLSNLRVLEARGQPLLSLSTLRIDGINAQGTPLQVAIKRVLIDSPKLRVNRQRDGSLNLVGLRKSRSDEGEMNADVFINTLAVRGGTVAFVDNNIVPTMATALSQLNGSLRSVDLRGRQRTQVKLSGYLPSDAAVALEGQVNINDPRQALDMTLHAEHLALTPYSSYASRYAGYALSKGLLSADLSYAITDGSVVAENSIRIDDLQWGERSHSSAGTNLPVRLGTELLKDVDGEIHLNVPLSGNISDPQFRVWPIVWQAVGHLITRAAATPFKLLHVLPRGNHDLGLISFTANSAALSESAKTHIKILAAALHGKPEMHLSITGHSDGVKDVMANMASQAASTHRYDLAKARAMAVQEALIADGVKPKQLVVEKPKANAEQSLSVSLAIRRL